MDTVQNLMARSQSFLYSTLYSTIYILHMLQIDSNTIDGNVEFVQFVQLYSYVTSVNSVFVSDKIINDSDNFRIKCLSYSKIRAILSVLYFLFLHFLWENLVFLVIFDTCDVVYNWFISLLPLIVLDNLFTYMF